MLPTIINDGWAYESVTTILLYPRNGAKTPEFSRSRRTIETDVWVAAINTLGQIVVLDASQVVQETITATEPLNVDLAFDQNDRYFVCWEQDDSDIYIRWYDPLVSMHVTTLIAEGNNPCCSIDDYRSVYIPSSDIFLCYQREDLVFYRLQRERYLIEHSIPHSLQDVILETCGMGTNLRFTIRVQSVDGIVLCAGQTPIRIENNYVGLYSGEIPWSNSSSNTET